MTLRADGFSRATGRLSLRTPIPPSPHRTSRPVFFRSARLDVGKRFDCSCDLTSRYITELIATICKMLRTLCGSAFQKRKTDEKMHPLKGPGRRAFLVLRRAEGRLTGNPSAIRSGPPHLMRTRPCPRASGHERCFLQKELIVARWRRRQGRAPPGLVPPRLPAPPSLLPPASPPAPP